MEPVDRDVDAAAEIAREAGDVLLAHFRAGVTAEYKGPRDLVTVADRDAEQLIRARLAAAFPGEIVVGEEGEDLDEAAVAGRPRWYVDPLDGTVNFLKGQRRWAVALARCDAGGHITIAAVYWPCHDETFVAARGGGTRCDGVAVHTSEVADLEEAMVTVGALQRGAVDRAAVAAIGRRVLSLRVTGSSVCDLADLACGRADGFVSTGSGRWDLAAGALLALEAGAVATTLAGAPADQPSDSLVAASPALQPQLAALLAGGRGGS